MASGGLPAGVGVAIDSSCYMCRGNGFGWPHRCVQFCLLMPHSQVPCNQPHQQTQPARYLCRLVLLWFAYKEGHRTRETQAQHVLRSQAAALKCNVPIARTLRSAANPKSKSKSSEASAADRWCRACIACAPVPMIISGRARRFRSTPCIGKPPDDAGNKHAAGALPSSFMCTCVRLERENVKIQQPIDGYCL